MELASGPSSPEFADSFLVEDGSADVDDDDYGNQQPKTGSNKQCTKCFKKFRSPGLTRRHMMFCDVNGFRCSECSHWFKNLNSAERHYESHTETNQCKCHICGKTFSGSRDRNYHERAHLREFQYKCSLCHSAFRDKCKKEEHERKDHRGKHWTCSLCDKWFIESLQLSKHVKWEHHEIESGNVMRNLEVSCRTPLYSNGDVSGNGHEVVQSPPNQQDSSDRSTRHSYLDLPQQEPIVLHEDHLIGTSYPNREETILQIVNHTPQMLSWQRYPSDRPIWVLDYNVQEPFAHNNDRGIHQSTQNTGPAAHHNHFQNQMGSQANVPAPLERALSTEEDDAPVMLQLLE